MSVWVFSDPIRLPVYLLRNQPLRFLLCPERLIFIFSICSKTSQRNSIFIRYNKGAVREERTILPQDANAGNENRTPRQKTDAAAPLKKHCPPLMRGNSQCGGQTTNHLLTTANVWEFSYDRQRRFLLLSTALPVFAFLAECSTRPPAQAGGLVRCTGADEKQFRIRACGACFPAGRPACPARCSGGRAGGAVRPR